MRIKLFGQRCDNGCTEPRDQLIQIATGIRVREIPIRLEHLMGKL